MVIKQHLRCNGDVQGTTLTLQGRNLSSAVDPEGDVQWYIAGAGAKKAGFATQQWIAKVHGIWYLRTPGGNGQRGQYKVSTDEWSTEVTEAEPHQVSTLETAQIR